MTTDEDISLRTFARDVLSVLGAAMLGVVIGVALIGSYVAVVLLIPDT